MMVISLFPQLHFAIHRGYEWQGANAISHPDEVAYSAYIASLIRGNPRRYDPYTGRGGEAVAAESLFSIQLVPAYAMALPGRWFGLSASTLFMLFPILCALASSLALFWFLSSLTRDGRLSAGAVIFVLCLGTLIARQGIVRYVPNLPYLIPMWVSERVLPPSAYHLPFLRLYQPAIAFPLFFVLCVFVWLALTEATKRAIIYAASAGGVLAVLVFSYFYLWTAAAAWLGCIGLLWLISRRAEFVRLVLAFGIISAFASPAAFVYFSMLTRRAATVDAAQALVFTHQPDLFRVSEVASFVVLVMLAIGKRRQVFQSREPSVLFTGSLAMMVVVVFNQQVVTGRSLQPIHYEWFIANYCALVAIVLTISLWRRKKSPTILTNKRLVAVACFALVWGLGEVWLAASVNYLRNRAGDELRPVAQLLTSRAQTDAAVQSANTAGHPPVVLVADLPLADRWPTDAPQPVLWAPRMLVFPGVSEAEDRERFFQQLYYLGYTERQVWNELDRTDWNFYAGLFPYYRLSRVVSGSSSPITPEELRARIRDYLSYISSFDRQRASSPTLSYIVVHAGDQFDFQRLDRWYQRAQGERIGGFIVYRVKLRE